MNKTLRKVIKFVLIAGGVALAIWAFQQVDLDPLKAKIESLGPWAPVGIFALRTISVVIPIVPSTIWAFFAGSFLDYPVAVATVVFADIVSCSLGFYLAKRYGRGLVEKLVGTRFMGKVDKLSQKHLESNFFLLAGALMTGAFDFVSYSAGLTTTKWKMFLPALVLGALVSDAPMVAIGANLFEKGNGYMFAGLAILSAFCLSILAGWLQKRASPSVTNE
ncbi:TVP38/TMEM64 family inner membrane protein YdjZ [Acaryochloris thomasi RCC1774]|uniref:TVP38/TMEM64 family membrane protein n=1 Tax=Acaryochloris thomasi RCC1774 TaxID=1764569 RepID=A0A2W1JKI8_9CYAN|nr:VTT domain-containing protein [Acaryochloris thomasi]PZD73908.1 TVP38/TMEM64 family inner membrane protein YdjZ [Acaryochloris thomasi RCC1774]